MRTQFVVLSVLALVLFSGDPAWAQASGADKPPMYTYVSTWAVPRAMWGDYLKNQAADDQVLSKAVADGTLVGSGSYSVLNHQEGQATHGSWFSARSMANVIKVLEGVRSAPDATAPVLAASKHWDYILASRDYNAHSGTFKNGYLRVGSWRYKAGALDPDGKIMKATMVAALEKLLADGALHSYQIDLERVHSSDPTPSTSPSLLMAPRESINSMPRSTKWRKTTQLEWPDLAPWLTSMDTGTSWRTWIP